MKASRLVLLLVLFAAVAAFFAFDLGRFFTLEQLRESQATFARWHAERPLALALAYFAVYVLITALSIPGATIITLAGGAVFGLWWGTLLVSFASTTGATLAFLVSRFILRDAVEQRFGSRLKEVHKGIEKEGAFYLFSLRLIPVVPFFVINLVMGLTRMRTLTFFWVSQIGMLAGTLVYVNAGTQLARIDSLKDILSPGLLASFVLLGVFPIIAKKVLDKFTERRALRDWSGQRPRQFDRNLVVIGAGAGGLVSAYIAATVKAKVTLVEAGKMGGDCLNYGCVPSKALIRSAKLAHQMQHAAQWGLHESPPKVNFPAVMERVANVIADIEPHDSVERYTGLGVDVVNGYARLVNPWTVEIDGDDGKKQTLTTRSIVLATGARPFVPPLPGLEESGYVTSDTIWERFSQREAAPERLLVLGGGPIGCELAQSFARLGSSVTIIEMGDRVLARETQEAADMVKASLLADGVELLTAHKALRCETRNGGSRLVVEHAGREQALPYDELLIAVGRQPRLEGYGLETLGIPTRQRGGTIETNEYLQTLYPNIYAVGDVTGPFQLTHAAAHQAWYAAVNALFGDFKRFKADYRVIPRVTFTDPEVASVGLSPEQADMEGLAVEVTRYGIDDLDRAIADGQARGFVQVVTPPGKDTILGVTIVGAQAGELLAEYVLAMKHGLGLNKILGTIHAYPTMAEANKYAAGEWKRAHAPEDVLRWVQKFHDWRRG
ncbi:FAD-dependent oxidoreductase [Hydrogenophaga sp. 5NK40-0174]|uniref:FAD-dependent oxidoreductase n=1 Tax=Hydrogenophaga sp. 5NK40-0174 TaxID=3127649 RepID=UPI003106648B